MIFQTENGRYSTREPLQEKAFTEVPMSDLPIRVRRAPFAALRRHGMFQLQGLFPSNNSENPNPQFQMPVQQRLYRHGQK